MCNVNAYTEAIKVFRDKDPVEMASNAAGSFAGNSVIRMKYLYIDVEVDYPSGEIRSGLELSKNEKVLILQYLTSTCGVHPRGTWISFIQLPDGPHHHTPFVMEAVNPLAADFGDHMEEFAARVRQLGAVEIKMGDYGVKIPVFAHIPLAVCLWKGDDEFPATANILFDITAPLHLTTAALWVLGIEVSRKIRGMSGQQFVNDREG